MLCPLFLDEFSDAYDGNVARQNKKKKGFPKGRKGTCRLCKETFPSNAMLAKHKVNVHNMENPYECETCDRAFNNQSNYRRHIISHLPLLFNCDICFLKFPTISKVATHKKKVHGIEQPVHWRDRRAHETQPPTALNDSVQDPSEKCYPCGLCELSFTSKKVKKTHKLDVHGVQEFEQHKCGTCDKVFQHKRTMRRHMQTCQGKNKDIIKFY